MTETLVAKKGTETLEEIEQGQHTYRMYVLVERHLSPLDKGIQAAHAIIEYANRFSNRKDYQKWAWQDKTLIILNGGTCKDLADEASIFYANNVRYSEFREEDLNDSLTAIAFLADERVFDYEEYPDFETWRNQKYPSREMHMVWYSDDIEKRLGYDPNDFTYPKHKKEYEEIIGDEVMTIREVLKGKHLAK